MKDYDIDDIIAEVKHLPLPGSPGSLESNVLRRIRLSRNDSKGTLWDWFTAILARPAFVAATFAIVVSVSSGATVLAARNHKPPLQEQTLASNALDFDVFAQNDILNLDAR